jgi:hypothetical protein
VVFALIMGFAVFQIVVYTAQWSTFPDKEDYFAAKKGTTQRILSFFADGLGMWLVQLASFEIAWLHWRRKTKPEPATPGGITQGHIMHVLAYLLHILMALGVFLASWDLVGYTVGRALAVVMVIPCAVVIIYSITHKNEPTWDIGWAIFFATAQFVVVPLANLLPTVMQLGGDSSLIFLVVKFFAFYIVYG